MAHLSVPILLVVSSHDQHFAPCWLLPVFGDVVAPQAGHVLCPASVLGTLAQEPAFREVAADLAKGIEVVVHRRLCHDHFSFLFSLRRRPAKHEDRCFVYPPAGPPNIEAVRTGDLYQRVRAVLVVVPRLMAQHLLEPSSKGREDSEVGIRR